MVIFRVGIVLKFMILELSEHGAPIKGNIC